MMLLANTGDENNCLRNTYHRSFMRRFCKAADREGDKAFLNLASCAAELAQVGGDISTKQQRTSTSPSSYSRRLALQRRLAVVETQPPNYVLSRRQSAPRCSRTELANLQGYADSADLLGLNELFGGSLSSIGTCSLGGQFGPRHGRGYVGRTRGGHGMSARRASGRSTTR